MDRQIKAQANAYLDRLTRKGAGRIPLVALLLYLLGGVVVVAGMGLLGSGGIMLAQIPTWACIVLVIMWFTRYRPIRKRIIALLVAGRAPELEQLACEVESRPNPAALLLGQRFLLLPKGGLLLEYHEIAWLFMRKQVSKVYGITVGTTTGLILATIYGRERSIALSQEQVAFIAAKNPALLLGYTEQTAARYRELVKANKGRR